MAAQIKASEIKALSFIKVHFGFTGLSEDQAIPIIRGELDEQWPVSRRPRQCIYVIRLRGEVAVAYGHRYSPVIYIGEGNAYSRLYKHAEWIASLLVSVPRAEIEVHVTEVARRNNVELYRYVEADMIKWFCETYGCLPWFNKQSERSKEGVYQYSPEAEKALRRNLLVGSGSCFLWAIRPTRNNDQFSAYSRSGNFRGLEKA